MTLIYHMPHDRVQTSNHDQDKEPRKHCKYCGQVWYLVPTSNQVLVYGITWGHWAHGDTVSMHISLGDVAQQIGDTKVAFTAVSYV